MKIKLFFVTVLLSCSMYVTTTFAQSSSAVNELAQLLSTYKTYQANFKQLTYSGDNRKPQASSGKLYMKRPGKFRWEVLHPNKQIIIANGRTLWVYDVELEQVTKERINKSTNNPAVLLSGDVNQIIKQYHVSKVQNRGKIWYQLKPRSSQSSFVLVRMHFSSQRLIAIWVKNNLGQTSIFQFSHIRLNVPLSSSLFSFRAPPGVDVLQ